MQHQSFHAYGKHLPLWSAVLAAVGGTLFTVGSYMKGEWHFMLGGIAGMIAGFGSIIAIWRSRQKSS